MTIIDIATSVAKKQIEMKLWLYNRRLACNQLNFYFQNHDPRWLKFKKHLKYHKITG